MSLFVGLLAFAVYSWRDQAPERSEPYTVSTDQLWPHRPSEDEPPDSANLDRDEYPVSESDAQEPRSKLQADLQWLREETTNDVLVTYSQMFRHLGLTTAEKNALTDFLVEVWMSETIMPNFRPEPIDELDRQEELLQLSATPSWSNY